MDDNETRAELGRIATTPLLRGREKWLCENLRRTLDLLAESQRALREIGEIIEAVDNRCMAVDGPVTPTLQEMTPKEIKRIYKLAKNARKEE